MKTKRNIYNICLLLMLLTMIFTGCSGGEISMVSPQSPNLKFGEEILSSIISNDNGIISGEGVWGLYQGHLDLSNLDAELVPIRGIKSGTQDSAEVDITSFLTELPCTNCAKIMGVALDGSKNPVVQIGIKHPFAPGDPSKPPTAINRLDLHVFNVRGFIVSDGHGSRKVFTAAGKTLGGFNLISADGYSGEFDSYWDGYFATQSNLHPYMLHFDDYGTGNFDPSSPTGFTDVRNPSGNLVMKMGCDYNVQNYTFKFEGSGTATFDFLYAITASYGVSATGKTQRLEPTYRIPQFNSKAASEVRVTEVDDSQFLSGNTSSKCYVMLEVMDINHGVPVGTEINQMSADSSVSRIDVEIPGVTNPVWSAPNPSNYYISGDGRATPLKYNLQITNDKGASAGNYIGLVKVTDSFTGNGNLPGNAIYRIPPGKDPTKAFFSVPEWATYAFFNVTVRQSCGPITGSITEPSQSEITIEDDTTVNFAGYGSSANGGDPIVEYKWAWGDGTNSSFGQYVSHKFNNPNCGGNNQPVNYTVLLILKDSCTPPNITQVDSVTVTVTCRTCFNYYENFDGGTEGNWSPYQWTKQYSDNSGLNYGGWDQYNNHSAGPNCQQSRCASGNCYFTSGDNIAEGMAPGFCNDYSGDGYYYLVSPMIDFTRLQVSEVTMTVQHFFNLYNGAIRDGCAVFASTDGGATFPHLVEVIGGEPYNSTFNGGLRNGSPCFTGLTSTTGITTSVFNLTPFIGQNDVVLRFEQHNNNQGAIGTPGYPVGWWIDEILIDICP